MDAVVYGALEEICSQGVNGLTLRTLWPKIHSHLSSNGLHLCTNVKKALWSNLLEIPALRFECKGVSFDAENPNIQSFEDSETMDLKIVAAEHLLNSFVGIYDIKASDAGISAVQRRALERLAIARTDGVTQNDIAKEFGIKGNNIYYILKNLETRGLIVRQSTIIRKKEAGYEGEHKNSSIVNTNMLHLHRYAKHLGRLQRLEITKEDKTLTDNHNAEGEIATGDIKEDVHIKDYKPALRAICDRLEKADGKVLVVPDLKKELGYRKTSGHRSWRNILHKLKDAGVVEEFCATVNSKKVSCLRLLKTFSPKTFEPKSHGGGDDDLDSEHIKLAKRGQITDQLLELPIEQQIYDMIDAEGSKGLIINEIYKRLGINNKRYYPRILDMVQRFQMHLDSESLNRGVVYRVWTQGNFNSEVSNTPPRKSENSINEKSPTHAQSRQLILVDNEEQQNINPISSEIDNNDDSRSSHNLQNEEKDIIPNEDFHIVNSRPSPSSASPAPRVRRSYTTYPCLGLNTVSSLREQRILEKLQEEKILLRPELLRQLENLENMDNQDKKHTMMDKRTLERSLNKIQEEGHCKCIAFAIPSVTNCGRKRTIDVILHPSVYKAEDLSDRVHERLRSFEKHIRSHNNFRKISDKSIPVLNDVERIYTNVRTYNQAEACESMRNNGFVLAKMVRAKLLHVFLWGSLSTLPNWDDDASLVSGTSGFESRNPHSTCILFELDAAIKSMPLELFLQVAGSTAKLEFVVEKCRDGLCLSDLPIEEYRTLVDTRATGRLSTLIDILRRLKLIRLIGGEYPDPPVGPVTTLQYALELKPYIEEPVGMVLPPTGVSSFDLRPHVRHDFVLSSRKGVDRYWNTLEYCYAASHHKAALHAFPGSAVHEIFFSRSWASVRVMTAEQRAALFKLVANEDSDKKISYKKCEKIAENLNLTLEQVLRVFYDNKRQKQKSKEAESVKEHGFLPLSYKRKRSSKGKTLNNEKTLTENTLDEDSRKLKHVKSLEDHETQYLNDEIDNEKEVIDDLELNADENTPSFSAIHECALSKLQASRQKRFAWSESKDRLLVIEYVKQRVIIGAKFHRVDWSSLENLPGPPDACRRRMSTLKRNDQFRLAVMKLCNMLTVKYAKHLEASKNRRTIIGANRNASDCNDNIKDLSVGERWDDFEKNDIKMVLDEVLRYKQNAKVEATKGARQISKYRQSDVGGERHEFDESTLNSTTTPMNEVKKDGGKKQTSSRRSRRHLPKNYVMLMNGGKGFDAQAYKSLAVSNAIELFKLIFLSTAKAPEVPNLLAETLRRYSEHDLFTAFNYLRERNFMVRGNGISHFVLSQQFLHSISSSPFPVNTGKRALKFTKWLHEKEKDLLENGVDLSADLQCGDVLQLCELISSGELSIFPFLPNKGVGEIRDSKKRNLNDNEVVEKAKKPKLFDSEIFFRKEKGFPGIQLSLSCSLISRFDSITLSRDENVCSSLLPSEDGLLKKSNVDSGSESTWEAMTCYARHLESSEPELSVFNPNLFKTVYSAIQKAGDQGLTMEEISKIIDLEGVKMAEIIVEVLEAFGRALKVNAYDSIHVVDSLYRSKYLLASATSHQHDLDTKDTADVSPTTADVSTTTADVAASTDKVHRVTILNHPEEIPQPISEIHSNNESESYKKNTENEKCEIGKSDSCSYKPILPWVNGDGTINEIIYKGLVRRVLGIMMQNPGILEEHVISQMNVLNPQSCRKLLELMILDSHITVRKMYQSVSNEPPSMLHRLLNCSINKPKLVCKEHLFANPRSISCL